MVGFITVGAYITTGQIIQNILVILLFLKFFFENKNKSLRINHC